MSVQPLPKSIFDKAVGLKIKKIQLQFSGGNDEGHLNVNFIGGTYDEGLESDVTDWAYGAFDFSGTGDGNDFGEDYEYDLKKKTVTTTEWFMKRKSEFGKAKKFNVSDKID